MSTNESIQNAFTKGLLTEYTGLNFPENAATDTDNCIYTLVGDVTRREGIDFEANFQANAIPRIGSAINTYKWDNAGGDGLTQVVVQQVGPTLYFYQSSSATESSPLSTQLLKSVVVISGFVATGAVFDSTIECQFANGNGYLFVYHPDCDPFYCTFTAGVITGTIIPIQIRDFVGTNEPGVAVNVRPTALTNEHLYNLVNQGWTLGNPWQAIATNSVNVNTGNITFSVGTGITGIVPGAGVTIYSTQPITPGALPTIPAGTIIMSGNVVSYSGSSLIITVSYFIAELFLNNTFGSLLIIPTNNGFINTWFSDIGNYPSNSDVWWFFKDDTNVFNPTTTVANVNFNFGQAPQGHFILPAFNQNRGLISSVAGLTPVSTMARPSNGAWFQGRVWFTGINAQQPASGDANFYTWSENIYFSQIVTTSTDFGSCYQTNDPTSQDLNGLLPTDGGVIQIQGAGSIYKLFPIANGMIVFAANGVWFITGSQGIGFAADDYTITKLSSVESISCTSYVDVMGLPYFWNEEGIYAVTPQQGGSLSVDPLTVGTILTFYNNIPLGSKKFARGAYHPIDYIVEWVYTSTQPTTIAETYTFDSVLNFNTYNKAFYPYSVDTTQASINGINYVAGPGGTNSPDPVFKYLSSWNGNFTFAEENDAITYADWNTLGNPINYDSFFITGYRLAGKSILKFQPIYIQMYSRTNGAASAYFIQGLWDYANAGNSGRWSSQQMITNGSTRADVIIRRHKIRGNGFALQLKVSSVPGLPFDIIGWNSIEQVNTGN